MSFTFLDGFDLCMLLLVIFFTVRGLLHGFATEIFSLVGVVGGIYLGLNYSNTVENLLQGFLPECSPTLIKIIAIALLFFAFCIVCALIGKMFTALLNFVALGSLDRMCGMVLGFVKGCAIVVIIVSVLLRLQIFLPGVRLAQSRVVSLVNATLPDIESYIDQYFPKQINAAGSFYENQQ